MALPRLEGTARQGKTAIPPQNARVSWHCPALRGLQVFSIFFREIMKVSFMALPRLEGTASIQPSEQTPEQQQVSCDCPGTRELQDHEGTASKMLVTKHRRCWYHYKMLIFP